MGYVCRTKWIFKPSSILAEQAIKQYPSDYQGQVSVSLKMQPIKFRLDLPDMNSPSELSQQTRYTKWAWIALNASGIQVPVAIADQSASLPWNYRMIFIAMQFFLWGRYADGWSWPHCIWTISTAKLHVHSKTWQAPENFLCGIMKPWSVQMDTGETGTSFKTTRSQCDWRSHCTKDLNFFGKTQERYGLIHAV